MYSMARLSIFLTLMVLTHAGVTLAQHPNRFISPDGKLSAVATPAGKEGSQKGPESRVEVYSSAGKLLAQRDYASPDGEHGYGVVKAAWTPDSQFFVYSLENSGGHQPWHTPVDFFVRADNTFRSFDNALKDAVINPQFEFAPPDKVIVELHSSGGKVTVSLQKLVTNTH